MRLYTREKIDNDNIPKTESILWWLIWLRDNFFSLFHTNSVWCIPHPSMLCSQTLINEIFLMKKKKRLLNIIYTKCVCLCKYDTVLLNEPKSQIKSHNRPGKKHERTYSPQFLFLSLSFSVSRNILYLLLNMYRQCHVSTKQDFKFDARKHFSAWRFGIVWISTNRQKEWV